MIKSVVVLLVVQLVVCSFLKQEEYQINISIQDIVLQDVAQMPSCLDQTWLSDPTINHYTSTKNMVVPVQAIQNQTQALTTSQALALRQVPGVANVTVDIIWSAPFSLFCSQQHQWVNRTLSQNYHQVFPGSPLLPPSFLFTNTSLMSQHLSPSLTLDPNQCKQSRLSVCYHERVPIHYHATGKFQALNAMGLIVQGSELEQLASQMADLSSPRLSDFQDVLFFDVDGLVLGGVYSVPSLDSVTCYPYFLQ